MKTSIIIPNWNTLPYLKKCVDSIKKNTKNIEIIIVDNGSKEKGTKEYIKKVSDKYIFNDTNLGFSKANNQGAKISSGNFLCFMNSDIIVGKDWLTEMIKVFDNPMCGSVGPLANPRFRRYGENQVIRYTQYKGQYKEDTIVPILIGFCLLIKKSLFKKIGGFSEKFISGNYEDNYFCYKIRKEGYDLWISSKSKVDHPNPSRSFDINKLDYSKSLEVNKRIFEELING